MNIRELTDLLKTFVLFIFVLIDINVITIYLICIVCSKIKNRLDEKRKKEGLENAENKDT